MLYLYNTASLKKEKFETLGGSAVKIYTCGPTVYNYAHIGNLSAYLFADFLKRYLRYSKYRIIDAMNVTDVDDKTIKASQEKRQSLKKYTTIYCNAVLDDFKKLNIIKPKIICRATDHIKEMIDLIKILMFKNYAYQADDSSVYFRIAQFKDYGKFAKIRERDLLNGSGGRTNNDEYSKDSISDFVLWKAWKKDDGNVFWESPWGKGRPGWHIECSAMSMKYLGSSFDIHTGAIDLIFPHHQNEIAQSEAATGKNFVRFWLHRSFLNVNGVKMAKSLGNMYTLKEILEKVSNPLAFRYLVLTNHYRQPLNFTLSSLQSANRALNRLTEFISRVREIENRHKTSVSALSLIKKEINENRAIFKDSLDDDLDTPKSIANLHNFVNKMNKLIDDVQVGKEGKSEILKYFKEIDNVWSFLLSTPTRNKIRNKDEIAHLLKRRDQYRNKGDWKNADKIKRKLLTLGITLQDTSTGTKWKISEDKQ